jgi:hypothetical protein
MQTRSASVYPQHSPTKNPLLSRLWWVSVAPFGKPVVPDVYWMLIGSSALSRVSRSANCPRSAARPASIREVHAGSPRKTTSRRSGQSSRTSATIAR